MSLLKPIHLLKEGYTSVEIAFDGKPAGVSAVGTIDADRDWIVRVTVDANTSDAIKERIDVPYSVFVSGNIAGHVRRDAVGRGVMSILPGPIGE